MADAGPENRKPRDEEIDTYGLSHPGKVRAENQDHYLMATIHKRMQVRSTNLPHPPDGWPIEEQRLASIAMVADGVGGGHGGGEASAIALATTLRYVDSALAVYYGARDDETEFGALLEQAAVRAHEAVKARQAEEGMPGRMATTLTLYIGVWPNYYLLQVGDSRYYLLRDGVLRQVTRDQTIAQDLVDQGALPAEVADRTPLAHVLSSAIGSDTSAPVVTRLPFHWDNVHLLCSDGLTKHVSHARIAEILGRMTSAQQACEQLLQEALDGGGSDNITVIVGRTVRRDG